MAKSQNLSEERDLNTAIIAEFRAKKGEVKAPYEDPPPMVLLHTIGAKSGREHIVPMRAIPDGEIALRHRLRTRQREEP